MCRYTWLALLLLGCTSSAAQTLPVAACADGNPDTSACAKAVASAFKSKNGKLRYRSAPVEICSLGGGFIISFGINEYYQKAGFHLDCEDVPASKPFNNTISGVRNGLWFDNRLLGGLKTVVEYDSGRVSSVLGFWPNGLPKRLVKYQRSGREVPGSRIFYKKQSW